jgi:TonB family protein
MKPIILAVLVLMVAASLDVLAQDVRSKVGPAAGTSMTNIIDPDKSIYGVQWGISEDEFISKFGNPTGYIKLNGSDTAMQYGKSHAFIFTASKLSGLRICMSVLDWKLSQSILTLTPFDGIRWQLSNGIRRDMNLAEVRKIVGDRLRDEHPGRYQLYFNSDNARIEIEFSHVTNEGDRDESYRVFGIYIRQAGSASGALRQAHAQDSKPTEPPALKAAQPTPRTPAASNSNANQPAFVQRARASMVAITGKNSAGQPSVVGTGFVIGENLIATNMGVSFSARQVKVIVAGQEPQTLEIVSRDTYRNAAILSVIRTETAAPQPPPLLLGDSDKVAANDKVYFTVGSGPQSFVSEGTIKERLTSLFEIDARATSGSYGGGPLFNREGEVIGILEPSFDGKNRFYAIASSSLKTLLQYRGSGTAAGDASSQPEQTSPAAESADARPRLIKTAQPRYTEEARKNKTMGSVNMSILVAEDGEVKETRITKGLPDGLNEQALAAVHQMRFKPAMRNGKAVSYWLPIAVEFQLR